MSFYTEQKALATTIAHDLHDAARSAVECAKDESTGAVWHSSLDQWLYIHESWDDFFSRVSENYDPKKLDERVIKESHRISEYFGGLTTHIHMGVGNGHKIAGLAEQMEPRQLILADWSQGALASAYRYTRRALNDNTYSYRPAIHTEHVNFENIAYDRTTSLEGNSLMIAQLGGTIFNIATNPDEPFPAREFEARLLAPVHAALERTADTPANERLIATYLTHHTGRNPENFALNKSDNLRCYSAPQSPDRSHEGDAHRELIMHPFHHAYDYGELDFNPDEHFARAVRFSKERAITTYLQLRRRSDWPLEIPDKPDVILPGRTLIPVINSWKPPEGLVRQSVENANHRVCMSFNTAVGNCYMLVYTGNEAGRNFANNHAQEARIALDINGI